MPRIILVSCGKTKAEGTREARSLYTGNLFRATREHAEAMVAAGQADEWLIISGRHGLVVPTEQLAPYDERVPGSAVTMSKWGELVAGQLANRYGWKAPLHLVVFGGVLYTTPIKGHLAPGWTMADPLDGLEVGERLSWLKKARVAREAALLPPAQAKKLLADELRAERARTAKHAAVANPVQGERLEAVVAVRCPACAATPGQRVCFKPVGTRQWIALGAAGVYHLDRLYAADAATTTAKAAADHAHFMEKHPELAKACPTCGAPAEARCKNYKGGTKPTCRERLAAVPPVQVLPYTPCTYGTGVTQAVKDRLAARDQVAEELEVAQAAAVPAHVASAALLAAAQLPLFA